MEGQRIKILSMTGDTAHYMRVTLENKPDRRRAEVQVTGVLPTGLWRIITRKDHAYEQGYCRVCPRCGDEQADHDRMQEDL